MQANHPGTSILTITLGVMLGSCTAAPPRPVVVPPPVVAILPANIPAPLRQDWRDAPITEGSWAWSQQGSASVARFDTASGQTPLRLVCDPAARTITLRLASQSTGDIPLSVTTTSERRVLPASGGSAEIRAVLPGNDPLLDAMAFSRGRFMVEAPGGPSLILPAWVEVSRVIEDCR